MNLRALISTACGALLLAGVSLQQASAQVIDTFTNGSFFVDASSGDLEGGAFDASGNLFSVFGTPTGPAVSVLGVITEPLQVAFVVATPGLSQGFIEGGTGDLNTINGVTSFTLDPGAVLLSPSPVPPFLYGGEMDFTFQGTPTPTVVGTTQVVGGVPITTGVYSNDFSTGGVAAVVAPFILPDGTGNGVAHVALQLPVPEPGTVSLLAGLAVAGSGLALRRRRRAA
jgi:hypothetical protein